MTFPLKSRSDAGKRLKAERERLRLSTRDVERLSNEIAIHRKNRYYYLSHTWLTDIEAGKFKPNIFKLHSLSLIYRRNLDEILAFFGLDIRHSGMEHGLANLPHTHLLKPAGLRADSAILAPAELRGKMELERTNLVSRMFAGWGEIPIELLRNINLQNSLCGYIGTKDCMLYPMIRPGSFVQIDPRQTSISSDWQNDFDRPIYFVELHEGFVCSWCELHGKNLILIPTPQSGGQARHMRYPNDAGIVGRVTAVTMRIAEVRENPAKGS